jgi:hypothetical protein
MKALLAIAAALGAAVLSTSPAAAADITTTKSMSCVPGKGARCTDEGKCKWREASARDKTQILVVDFASKTASIQRGDKRKKMGDVVGDKVTGDVREVVISRTGKRDPRNEMVLLVKASGAFTGWRAAKRMRFEGTCKAVKAG